MNEILHDRAGPQTPARKGLSDGAKRALDNYDDTPVSDAEYARIHNDYSRLEKPAVSLIDQLNQLNTKYSHDAFGEPLMSLNEQTKLDSIKKTLGNIGLSSQGIADLADELGAPSATLTAKQQARLDNVKGLFNKIGLVVPGAAAVPAVVGPLAAAVAAAPAMPTTPPTAPAAATPVMHMLSDPTEAANAKTLLDDGKELHCAFKYDADYAIVVVSAGATAIYFYLRDASGGAIPVTNQADLVKILIAAEDLSTDPATTLDAADVLNRIVGLALAADPSLSAAIAAARTPVLPSTPKSKYVPIMDPTDAAQIKAALSDGKEVKFYFPYDTDNAAVKITASPAQDITISIREPTTKVITPVTNPADLLKILIKADDLSVDATTPLDARDVLHVLVSAMTSSDPALAASVAAARPIATTAPSTPARTHPVRTKPFRVSKPTEAAEAIATYNDGYEIKVMWSGAPNKFFTVSIGQGNSPQYYSEDKGGPYLEATKLEDVRPIVDAANITQLYTSYDANAHKLFSIIVNDAFAQHPSLRNEISAVMPLDSVRVIEIIRRDGIFTPKTYFNTLIAKAEWRPDRSLAAQFSRLTSGGVQTSVSNVDAESELADYIAHAGSTTSEANAASVAEWYRFIAANKIASPKKKKGTPAAVTPVTPVPAPALVGPLASALTMPISPKTTTTTAASPAPVTPKPSAFDVYFDVDDDLIIRAGPIIFSAITTRSVATRSGAAHTTIEYHLRDDDPSIPNAKKNVELKRRDDVVGILREAQKYVQPDRRAEFDGILGHAGSLKNYGSASGPAMKLIGILSGAL